jgi:hypothetical protein
LNTGFGYVSGKCTCRIAGGWTLLIIILHVKRVLLISLFWCSSYLL